MTLPTPVFAAGGAFCLLAGYLVGAVTGPDAPARSTATVVSFERSSSKLCLKGDSVKDDEAADADGVLCGTWSHPAGVREPRKGDRFRFVTTDPSDEGGQKKGQRASTVIYGTVVQD